MASLFIGSTFLLILNLPFAPVWAKLLRIPRNYLYAGMVAAVVITGVSHMRKRRVNA